MDVLQSILSSAVTASAVAGAIVWFSKKLIEARVDARLSKELERFRSDLQRQATEHQIRFSKLHEKRAEVIATVYGHVVDAIGAAESLLFPMQWQGEASAQDKYNAATGEIHNLRSYLAKHVIYLPRETGDAIEGLARRVRELLIDFGAYLPHADMARRELSAAQMNGWKSLNHEVAEIKSKLEDELRKLLGGA